MKEIHLDAVEDILDNLRAAREFAGPATPRDAFVADRKTVYAVTRALEIVGEAAKRVPAGVRDRFPAVPWRKLAGLRDVIVHQYDRIDGVILHEIVTLQVPSILRDVEQAVSVLRREAGEPPE